MLYYPEENHIPCEEACNDFNARVMKHLMKTKMQKNDTFYVSKVLKGNNNFLRRDNSAGNMPVKPNSNYKSANAPLRKSQAVYNTQ